MPRPKLQTREERLEKKRLYERRRKERIKGNDVKREEFLRKDRERYARKKAAELIVSKHQMTPSNLKILRRKNKECNNLKRTHKELGTTPAATKSHSRPVIAKVYLYLEKEYEYMKTLNGSNCDLSPLADILKRTADATGVSEEDVITVMESEELSYHLPDRAKRKRRKKNEFIPNESDGNDYLIEDILKEENDDIIDDNLQEEYDDMLEDNSQDENNDIEDNLLEENDDMLEDNLQDENDDIEDNLQEENDDMLEDNLQDENDDMLEDNLQDENDDIEPNLPEENDDMLDDNLQENDDIEDQRLSEEEVTLDLETTSPGCNVDGVSLEAEDIRVKLEPLNSLTQDPLHPDYSGSCVTSETALPKIKLEPEEDEMEEPKMRKPALAKEKRKEKKRLYEQKRRQRIKSDPVLREEFHKKDRERYARRKAAGLIIPRSAMNLHRLRKLRKKNLASSKAYYKRKRNKIETIRQSLVAHSSSTQTNT